MKLDFFEEIGGNEKGYFWTKIIEKLLEKSQKDEKDLNYYDGKDIKEIRKDKEFSFRK